MGDLLKVNRERPDAASQLGRRTLENAFHELFLRSMRANVFAVSELSVTPAPR
jgi:hypothetical protein